MSLDVGGEIGHRLLACKLQALGVELDFGVAAPIAPEAIDERTRIGVGVHVIRTHTECDTSWDPAGLVERPEFLGVQGADEGLALPSRDAHGCADCRKFGLTLAPGVAVGLDPHTDDARGTKQGGLLLEAADGEVACFQVGLGKVDHFTGDPTRTLAHAVPRYVVKRRAHNLADGLDAAFLGQEKLRGTEVADEEVVTEGHFSFDAFLRLEGDAASFERRQGFGASCFECQLFRGFLAAE